MNRADAKRIAAKIRRVLKQDWDPIGAWTPDDEYDEFVWRSFGMLIEGKSLDDVTRALQFWSDEYMKCPVDSKRTAEVAAKLVSIGTEIQENEQ